MMKKHIIWSSEINVKYWEQDFNEAKAEGSVSENTDIYDWASRLNYCYLEDERVNLNIPLDGKIIAIGNMNKGRTKSSYLIFDKNINAILKDDYNYGESEYYSDGYNIRSTKGDNHYEYREIREGRNILNLIDRIYNGEPISRKMLNYYTKSLAPQVNKVYGW